MEAMLVFAGGLLIRLLLFVLLFALFATPIVAVIYLTQGVAALRRRAAGTVDAGGAHWKPGLAYTAAHTWVQKMWGRSVKVGLDDVARRILSGVSSVTLPPVGAKLRRGDMLVAVRCGERLVAIPSPVNGIVIQRNLALLNQPALFEHEPYGHGWMLRNENLRLNHFLEARLGMAAADGGTLTAPPSALLSEKAWREVADLFLRSA